MDLVDQELGKGRAAEALLCFLVTLAAKTKKAGGGRRG